MNDTGYYLVLEEGHFRYVGYLESENKKRKTCVLRNAMRIWYWVGADSLSQLATEGTTEPERCCFSCEIDKVEVGRIYEMYPVTEKAKQSFDLVQRSKWWF